jgi:hypothetical protein
MAVGVLAVLVVAITVAVLFLVVTSLSIGAAFLYGVYLQS